MITKRLSGSPPDRRQVLAGLAAAGLAAALPAACDRAQALELVAAERPRLLPGCSAPSAAWSYGPDWPLILRAPRGMPFAATLINRLREHTTIHWHGIRLPIAMDGVPHMTQAPVLPHERFTYGFTPPDPGTYFFHTHCNTAEALGRGLAGVLLIDDPREAGLYDLDQVLVLKDWRVEADGRFQPFVTAAGASRTGTFGALRTVNGGEPPTLAVPPGARVRLRLVNVDVTRIVMLGVAGATAAVIATDGNACPPFPAAGWSLGPAMRVEIGLVTPDTAGTEIRVEDIWPATPRLLARLVTAGPSPRRDAAIPALPPAELPEPDLAAATPLSATLLAGHDNPLLEKWLAESGFGLDALCLASQTFWSINRQSWPGMTHDRIPPPLFELRSGKSYVLEIFNGTPHRHPIHLHGHSFRVLGSSSRELPPHWSDTVLVEPKERLTIGFVAGTPGDWMFHCHIIEHQETGMMGYLRVT